VYYYEVDEIVIRREKAAARELRNSRWWQNLISAKPTCHYCSVILTKSDVTMDHVLPIARGGKSTKGNVVIACKPCNINKKDQLLIDLAQAQN